MTLFVVSKKVPHVSKDIMGRDPELLDLKRESKEI